MSRLPNAKEAIVDKDKITQYLLSLNHPSGKTKARFFNRFGFDLTNWKNLKTALLYHAQNNEVINQKQTLFGVKYVIDGLLPTPDGRNPKVRTIWFVETGQKQPRFVSAYPLKEKRL